MTTAADLIRSLPGRRVTVVGGGVSGVSAARVLQRLGAKVLVSDKAAVASPALSALMVPLELGGHSARIAEADLIVVSPGVPPEVLTLAGDVPVVGEMELAYVLLEKIGFGKTRLVAVTGTNGKTTTTALIGHIIAAAGRSVFVGGNIGAPLSDLALLPGSLPELIVLEVSSYQAEGLRSLAADVAVYLNMTPDHLDRYASVEEYAAAKERLFALQNEKGVAVLNADDARVLATPTRASKQTFSTEGGAADAQLPEPDTGTVKSERYALAAGVLRGKHNRQNQLAAILATRALGLSSAEIQKGLDSFAGVEHRIERVREVAGVQYFNDSKATNDDAAAKALLSFAQPIVWLAGGKDKHGGYAACVAAGRGRVKQAILFGEAAPLIEAAMQPVCPCQRVEDLRAAVSRAAQLAKKGDVVLLSPACSSFDQFKNYEERGRLFKTLVNALPEVA